MSNETLFRAVVSALSALGVERLREIGARAHAPVNASDDATQLALNIFAILDGPDALRHHGVTDIEVETIGIALGLGTRSAWRPKISAEEFERLPFFSKPSYDQDVWNVLSSVLERVPVD